MESRLLARKFLLKTGHKDSMTSPSIWSQARSACLHLWCLLRPVSNSRTHYRVFLFKVFETCYLPVWATRALWFLLYCVRPYVFRMYGFKTVILYVICMASIACLDAPLYSIRDDAREPSNRGVFRLLWQKVWQYILEACQLISKAARRPHPFLGGRLARSLSAS